jgi:molecular chaperone GrpE
MLRAIADSEDARRELADRTEKARTLSAEELVAGGHVPGKVVELLGSERERARVAQEAMLRAIAESEDVRRRLTAQQEKAVKVANEDLLKALLPVLDNLELCLQHSDTEDAAQLREAIEMTLRQWYAVFEKAGAVKIPAERGGAFDPGVHEGVMQDADAEMPPDTIARILQTGFSFHGRLLRPTRVSVSTGEGPSTHAAPRGAERAKAGKAKVAARGRRRAGRAGSARKKQPKKAAGRKKATKGRAGRKRR